MFASAPHDKPASETGRGLRHQIGGLDGDVGPGDGELHTLVCPIGRSKTTRSLE